MTLPSSPPITLSAVQNEFGAPSSARLSDFLRGGSYVPNTPANSGVPTSLPIKLQDLLGASSDTAVMQAASQADTALAPNTAYAGLEFAGSIVRGRQNGASGPVNTKFTWLLGGSASDYEVRATHNSGSVPAGSAMSTWLNASTNPEWHIERNTVGTASSNFTVAVRPAGGGSIISSASWSLSAEQNSGP